MLDLMNVDVIEAVEEPGSPPVVRIRKKNKRQKFIDAVIDSVVVGGIAGLSTLAAAPDATLNVVISSAGMAFLLKLKGLRKMSSRTT